MCLVIVLRRQRLRTDHGALGSYLTTSSTAGPELGRITPYPEKCPWFPRTLRRKESWEDRRGLPSPVRGLGGFFVLPSRFPWTPSVGGPAARAGRRSSVVNQSRVNASISPSFPRIGKRTFGISSLGKVLLGFLLLFTVPGKGRAETLQGTAIDPRRSPVPRATVRLLDAAGAEVARTLTDDQGRFHFEGLAGTTYTVEVSLTGFETASAKAVPGQQVKIVLPVAPVRESVIVTATRTDRK